MNVRPYKSTDRADFINICLKTAGEINYKKNEDKFITALYCEYYIENEPENCFALTDDEDNAVGYIICSINYGHYRKNINKQLKYIHSLGIRHYLFALGEVIGHGLYKKKFPAHLHIDILPDYQHSGGGTMLMNELKKHLKSNGINSVHLMVNSGNKNAVKFYKKNGFCIHSDFKKFYVMACDF
ncbi:MAG: GNAT family N-acetyltransferase [Clostridia bacterium]|nr:GNAT family N-acetyltransferase [Clostridia bacterium]